MKEPGESREFRKPDFDKPSWLFRFAMAVIRPLLTGPFLFRPFVESLGLSGKERVLELGCGNGVCLAYLARALEKGGQAVGVDTSSFMAERAKRRLEGFDNVKVRHGDIRSMDLTGNFDLVVFIHVLHDIEPEARLETLEALAGLLGPGGGMCFMEPVSPAHGIAPAEIGRLLEKAGFVDIRMTPMGRRVRVLCRKAGAGPSEVPS